MAFSQPYTAFTPAVIQRPEGPLPVPARMTLEEFELFPWPRDEHWELIQGVPVMAPSGVPDHHGAIVELGSLLSPLMRTLKRGFIVYSECDVILPELDTKVRPDLMICPRAMRQEWSGGAMRGTPAVIVEVLSRTTASNDLGTKMDVYEHAGVEEYWVFDPATCGLMLFERVQGAFRQAQASRDGYVRSAWLGKELRVTRDDFYFDIHVR